MNYIWPPCLLLCVNSIAAALFISSICLGQLLVLLINHPVLFFRLLPQLFLQTTHCNSRPSLPLTLNCHVSKGDIREFKRDFFIYNLCVSLKSMKTLFFKYTK